MTSTPAIDFNQFIQGTACPERFAPVRANSSRASGSGCLVIESVGAITNTTNFQNFREKRKPSGAFARGNR